MEDKGSSGRTAAFGVLFAGVVAISSAAVFVRTSDASGLVTAAWRLFFAAGLMFVIRTLVPRSRGSWGSARGELVFAGVCVGLHFWAFMQSLWMTSIASSVFCATTTPLWAALLAPLVAGEPTMKRLGWAGMAVALSGGAVMALSAGSGQVTIAGMAVATLSAWCITGYLLVGRRARAQMGVLEFGMVTTGIGAALLFAIAGLSGAPLSGFGASTWWSFLALAAIPQLVGHNALIWALRFAGAAVVSLAVLLEPAGATLLGWLVLGEVPGVYELLGGSIVFVGLVLIVSDRRPTPVSRETPAG